MSVVVVVTARIMHVVLLQPLEVLQAAGGCAGSDTTLMCLEVWLIISGSSRTSGKQGKKD
jgi:hypothetical protein